MFYKHYNGGEYLTLGFVHEEEIDITKAKRCFLATHEGTLENINVYMYDGEFHADVDEEMVLYMGQGGELWLRNSEDFYGYVNEYGSTDSKDKTGKRRFKLM